MDVAYDHIQQESHSDNEQPPKLSTTTPAASSSSSSAPANATQEAPITLEHEFQQAFRAVSSSPWGAKLGGFFGQVKKQSESLYVDAQKEYATAAEQASRGFTGLLNHTRNISLPPLPPLPELAPPGAEMAGTNAVSFSDPNFVLPEQEGGKKDAVSESSTTAGVTEEDRKRSEKEGETSTEHTARPDSLPADIVKEASSLVTRFRTEAPSFISRIQKAEDAADEALLKFGSGLRNFLREAVTVTAPSGNSSGVHKNGGDGGESTELLFETNDAEGKRVFHSSRFDAQLHVIHTTSASFVQDPESAEYAAFAAEFDVDSKTEDIARDLEEYEELRRAMEKLTPEKVEYRTFWSRYYFLRKVIGEEERRRKEVLRGAAAEPEEELSWGSDDEDEDEDETDPTSQATTPHAAAPSTSTSTTTLTSPTKPKPTPTPTQPQSQITPKPDTNNDLLRPSSPRHSEEDIKSTADSDASYDLVSGATSRAPGSPTREDKERKEIGAGTGKAVEAVKEEESDEEDWE